MDKKKVHKTFVYGQYKTAISVAEVWRNKGYEVQIKQDEHLNCIVIVYEKQSEK